MKILAAIIVLLFTVIFFIMIANPVINFSPFSIKLRSIYHAIGFFMILIGIGLVKYDGEKRGYEKGMNDAGEILDEAFAQYVAEKNKSLEEK